MIRMKALPRIGAMMVIAVTIAAVWLLALTSPVGASEDCGTYSFGFPGTRLLNDGISDSAGPYPIDLPGGTYTVTLVAHDHHDTQVGALTQPGEQYYVALDSGYASPPSTDIADDENWTTSIFTSQRVEASTAITVRHAGTPGINSVDVVCVGFTPEPTTEPVVEPPAVTEPPAALDPPVVDPPAETPTQDIGDPVTIVRPPDIAPPASIAPEVKGAVELPPIAPQLAATGPGAHGTILVAFGTLMIALGAALIRRERRFRTSA